MDRESWTLNSSTLAWQRENAGDNICLSLYKAIGLRLLHGNAAQKGSRIRPYSETPGLASGPATYQPSDLGHHPPTFSYLLSLTYTIEIIIPTLHPGRVIGDNCRWKHWPTEKHETQVEFQYQCLHPNSPRPEEAQPGDVVSLEEEFEHRGGGRCADFIPAVNCVCSGDPWHSPAPLRGSGLLGNLCFCPCRFPPASQSCSSLFFPQCDYSLIPSPPHMSCLPDPYVWL